MAVLDEVLHSFFKQTIERPKREGAKVEMVEEGPCGEFPMSNLPNEDLDSREDIELPNLVPTIPGKSVIDVLVELVVTSSRDVGFVRMRIPDPSVV